MASSLSADPFTLIDSPSSPSEDSSMYPHQIFTNYKSFFSAKAADLDIQLTTALRRQYPSHTLTIIAENNCPLLAYATYGHAIATVDDKTEPFLSYRVFLRSTVRGQPGRLVDSSRFAKYNYVWEGGEFVMYRVQYGFTALQYILCEPVGREKPESRSMIADGLVRAVGEWVNSVEGYVFVFDQFWSRSRALYEEVQKARWDDVILDEELKVSLTELVGKFFDSKDVYDDLGVPWKRGIILWGPPGNGKTISIKALMHTLSARKDPIPSLYVKSAQGTFAICNVFTMARQMAPCLLIFEDIDTIVNINTRAYFFNEVDGLESNDGIMMVASTNYLERLDPGLTKRPSRFDRKYLFPLPNQSERTQYCSYWRHKLNSRSTNKIDFPTKLCPALALLMDGFSFAYMKEAFVATLLIIAGQRQEQEASWKENDGQDDDKGNDLDSYQIFREMKKQIKLLREDMGTSYSSRRPDLFSSSATQSYAATTPPANNEEWKPVFNAKAHVGGFPMKYEVGLKGRTRSNGRDSSIPTPNNFTTSKLTTSPQQASDSELHSDISTPRADKDWKSNFKIRSQIGTFPFLHDLEVECNSRHVDTNVDHSPSLDIPRTGQIPFYEMETSPPNKALPTGHHSHSHHQIANNAFQPPTPFSIQEFPPAITSDIPLPTTIISSASLPYRQRSGARDAYIAVADPFCAASLPMSETD